MLLTRRSTCRQMAQPGLHDRHVHRLIVAHIPVEYGERQQLLQHRQFGQQIMGEKQNRFKLLRGMCVVFLFVRVGMHNDSLLHPVHVRKPRLPTDIRNEYQWEQQAYKGLKMLSHVLCPILQDIVFS